jgi:hypothetical protein
MLTHELAHLPTTKPVRLNNVTCPYCGTPLTEENTSREHVVGRKFVPKGALENQWNLILKACRPCNNRKAYLEDDISAISMQPDILGQHFGQHAQLAVDAAHKAKRTRSRYTGKLVADSDSSLQIKAGMAPGLTMTFNMIGQPQIEQSRLFELALRHFQAFFYFITYDHQKRRGWCWRGSYAPIEAISRRDWGNEIALSFMNATRHWETRVKAITAKEHFKLGIRKHPDKEMWALAVEWNENYRVIGLCGMDAALREMLISLPKRHLDPILGKDGSWLAARTEIALNPCDDTLFDAEPDQQTPSSNF